MSSSLQRGIALVQQAVNADKSNDVRGALTLYDQSLALFHQALQEEQQASMRSVLEAKISEYGARADLLRKSVASSGSEGAVGGVSFPSTPSSGGSNRTPSPSAPGGLRTPPSSTPSSSSPARQQHPLIALYASKYPVSQPNLQAALDLAEQATGEDKRKQWQNALDLYTDVLERFMVCLQAESNPQIKKSLRTTMESYIERAEAIKKHFDLKPTPRPAPGTQSLGGSLSPGTSTAPPLVDVGVAPSTGSLLDAYHAQRGVSTAPVMPSTGGGRGAVSSMSPLQPQVGSFSVPGTSAHSYSQLPGTTSSGGSTSSLFPSPGGGPSGSSLAPRGGTTGFATSPSLAPSGGSNLGSTGYAPTSSLAPGGGGLGYVPPSSLSPGGGGGSMAPSSTYSEHSEIEQQLAQLNMGLGNSGAFDMPVGGGGSGLMGMGGSGASGSFHQGSLAPSGAGVGTGVVYGAPQISQVHLSEDQLPKRASLGAGQLAGGSYIQTAPADAQDRTRTPGPIHVSKNTKSMARRKPLNLTASLDYNAFLPGEPVKMNVEVHNRSTLVVNSLKVTLQRLVRNMRTDGKGQRGMQTEKQEVFKNEYFQGARFPLPAESDYVGELTFPLPEPLEPTSMEHQGVFEREYIIKLECDFSYRPNLKVRFPIIILNK